MGVQIFTSSMGAIPKSEAFGHWGGAQGRAVTPVRGLGIRLGCPLDVSLGRCFKHAHLGGDPGTDPGHTGEIYLSAGLGTSRCPLGGVGGCNWGEECLDVPA